MKDDFRAKKIIEKALRNVKEQLVPLVYGVDLLIPQPVSEQMEHMGTDGQRLFYNADDVVKEYLRGNVSGIEYEIMHIVLHGILGHYSQKNQFSKTKLAWRIMDRQVEQILDELMVENPSNFYSDTWFTTIGMGLYYQAVNDKKLAARINREGKRREIDDHNLWPDEMECSTLSNESSKQNQEGQENCDAEKVADKWEKAREYLLGGKETDEYELTSNIAEILKNSKPDPFFGVEANNQTVSVIATGNQLSFTEVFKDFLRNKTSAKDQIDYFDRMIYQYGKEIYDDLLLLEPMEEIEERKMSNLVIAIDTSGSCMDFLGVFLNQLVAIFKEICSNFKFEKVYLIQCDARIQNVCEFEQVNELLGVKKTMRMFGLGGTDFRPVFSWIQKQLLNENKEVDCLLYFSDTEGSFPKEASPYPAFFIAPTKEYLLNKSIPQWIKKVYLLDNKSEKAEML